MAKLVAFSGSIRKDSFNRKLIEALVEIAKSQGVDTQYLDLKDYPLPIYNGDLEEEEGIPENALIINQAMQDADGFILACPEYNGFMTPLMKNTIDWVSRPTEKGATSLLAYKEKTALLLGASPGALGGIRGIPHMRTLLSQIGTSVFPTVKGIPKAHEAFNDDGSIKEAKLQKDLEKLVERFVIFTKKLKD